MSQTKQRSRLYRELKRAKIKLADVASVADIPYSSLHGLVYGDERYQNPGLDRIRSLCHHLSAPVGFIFDMTYADLDTAIKNHEQVLKRLHTLRDRQNQA